MFATLLLTLVLTKPTEAPAINREMAHKLSLASQNYGSPAVPASQLSRGTGLYMSPSDDIWVYAHASDPQKDEFIRAWGANGRALAFPGDDPAASSWSILKWDLSGFKPDAKILEAQLIFSAAPDSGYTAADAKESPLEARPSKSTFNETTWDNSDAASFGPVGTETDIFGDASPANISPTGFKIVIDLMKGPADFKDYFTKAMKKDKMIAIAITSKIDPSKVGREGIYKMYSKDAADPMLRPALRLVLEDKKKS